MRTLFGRAMIARLKYRNGLMSRDEVIKIVQPYIDVVNTRAKANAKRYGVPFKKVSLTRRCGSHDREVINLYRSCIAVKSTACTARPLLVREVQKYQ